MAHNIRHFTQRMAHYRLHGLNLEFNISVKLFGKYKYPGLLFLGTNREEKNVL
jgi:hypothetical protein